MEPRYLATSSAVKAAVVSPQIDPFSLMANAKNLPSQEELNPKWLGEEQTNEKELLALLKPCPDEALKILAGRQNGRQRKKQWASANFASPE
jgi:hypothetical protein